MPTTTNFGWTTPADTDYVKDGALAIRTLGNGIDTSLVDLKGGTSGQYLVKNSNTDLDFTWTTNTADIDGITATSPLTGGGTSGTITVGIQDGTTAQKGAVQLEDSTSSTSTTKAATPNSVKSAYDLANGAIPKTLTTTTGDIIYASSANTPARLGIGSSGNVLTVSGGVPTWAAPAGGGKVLQVVSATSTTATTITTDTMADTGITATITPTASNSKILVLISAAINIKRSNTDIFAGAQLMRGATKIADWFPSSASRFVGIEATGASYVAITNQNSIVYLDSPATTSSTTYKLQAQIEKTSNSASIIFQPSTAPSTITLLEIGA
jgi:hypothetical protein